MKLARSVVAIMAIAALAACDDEDDPTDEGSNLEGEYTVSSFEYTADDGDPSVDLASLPAELGCPCGILSMDVDADNNFSGQLRFPGSPAVNISGDLEVDGNDITVDFSDATEQLTGLEDQSGTFTLTSGGTLTMTLPDVTFDFTPFGGEEDTPSVLVLVGAQVD